ncbi:sensor histidine kinase [Corynebacterium urinipleomorphum]|uniref:sensor histidine kinase n=1 Tax=Corynebacterium urinipleomorphum TaxID=1852380 RepID=UPI001F21A0B5|nr:histidine kinase [Corynebacterium urinipleomorphum]
MKTGELVVTLLGAVLALMYTGLLFTGHTDAADWLQALLSWGFVAALAQWQSRPMLASALMVGLNVLWSMVWLAAPTNIGYTLWTVLVPLAVYTARRRAGATSGGAHSSRPAAAIALVAAAWCVVSPFMWTWDDRLILFYREPFDAALMLGLHWAVIAVAYLLAANGAAEEEAKDKDARMREERLAAAREEERLNTARDIHDVLGHSLTLITVQANAGLAAGTERESLELIRDTAADALADIRILVKGLRDAGPGLEPAGGVEEIPRIIDRFRSAGMNVALAAPADLDIPAVTAQAANRIITEALTNAVKHQHEPVARVTVARNAASVVVTVTSTGHAEPHPGAGTGIVGMRERARATGGTLDITHTEDHDETTVTVTATLGV